MNVAFPAILTFLILLPGFVARSRFKRVERTIIDHSPFGHAVPEGVVWATLLHWLWIVLMELFTDRRFAPEVLISLLSADHHLQGPALRELATQFNGIAAYFLSLLLAAYVLPSSVRWLVTRYRLDIHANIFSRALRFHGAPWYYLLTGAEFSKEERPDLIAVSVVVDLAGTSILYVGILEDFFVDQEGSLDRIVLSDTMRRPITADKNLAGGAADPYRFYSIDGDYFVLRYSEVTTMNVEYIKLETNSHSRHTTDQGALGAPHRQREYCAEFKTAMAAGS